VKCRQGPSDAKGVFVTPYRPPRVKVGPPCGVGTKREHSLDRLRGLPSRADIHDLEHRLGERMDSLAVRFDRAFDPHLS